MDVNEKENSEDPCPEQIEPEIAGPPVEEYPDDTPLEALRPRVAAPEAPAERGPRAAAAYALVWTDVTCNSCHQVSPQCVGS